MTAVTHEELAAEVDEFFTNALPPALDGVQGSVNRARAWRGALHQAGLSGLDYPVEYGGRGLDATYKRTYTAAAAGRVPPEESVFGIGIGMALPTVRDHGSPGMKERLIARGLSGEDIWCQLYSEPGSGSDLASLSTRAVLDGDEWVVTGQKVWTSGAQNADVAVLLARTNVDVPKHRGITMLVLPMKQDAVTVRPLKQMTGAEEFNEVFIDEARVPADWVIGEVDNGWRTAVALLAHERVQTGVASVDRTNEKTKAGRNPIPVDFLRELAVERGRLDDPVVRDELAGLYATEQIIRFLRDRGNTHPSIGKLWRTKQGRRAADFAARIAFPASPAWSPDDEDADYFQYHVLNCRGMSLGGGTDEIQRNTIGEQVLGLPREPAVDKDVPYKDVAKNT